MSEMTDKEKLPHYAKRIVALREGLGLSQKDLGIAAGVTAPAITMWETGRRFPRGKNLKRLAAALGVSESAILDDTVPTIQTPALANSELSKPRNELLGEIIVALSSLDDDQLDTVREAIVALSALSSRRKLGTTAL